MKLAIVGSRNLFIDNIEKYIPEGTTEIISGGAKGVDSCAKSYALSKNLTYTEFIPEYNKYGRAAPIVRNKEIVSYSDTVLVFWDGKSKGTKSVIDLCKKSATKIIIHIINNKTDT